MARSAAIMRASIMSNGGRSGAGVQVARRKNVLNKSIAGNILDNVHMLVLQQESIDDQIKSLTAA